MLCCMCNSLMKLHQVCFYYERSIHIWFNFLRRWNEVCIYCERFVFTGYTSFPVSQPTLKDPTTLLGMTDLL